jgi:RNA polymerase sigma-70 factor (ECF subfamily)
MMRRLATVLGVEVDFADVSERELTPGMAAREDAGERTIALFRALREPLGRYLASLGARQPEIEEIVQEAFLRVHRHLSDVNADTQNLQGWVFRVAQNLLRDRQRGWHGRKVDSLEDRPEAALASAPGSTPEERVLHLEKVRRLRTAWQALPDRQRRCLQLRTEGLRYREIAIVLGVSVTTVADLVRESLARLGRARDDA